MYAHRGKKVQLLVFWDHQEMDAILLIIGIVCRRYARCWWHLTLHIINIEKNVSRLLFHFFLPNLCLHTVGLVRMEVVWVCFDVLFFISKFHFFFYWFLFYFGLFVYICAVGVFLYVFISMFVCLLIHFVCIPFLYLFIVYVMWLYFIIFSLKVYLALKRDYHILFAYWLMVYDVFLKISRNILCII
jgi:hypothetical protein